MSKKILIIGIIIAFVVIVIISILIAICMDKEIDVSYAKHAVTIEPNVDFYKKTKLLNVKIHRELKLGTNVYVLEEITDKEGNKWSVVVINNKKGYVLSSKLGYFKPQEDDKVVLVDVSKFNKSNFKDGGELGAFIINNKVSYVYIRGGGRGYGEEGKFYEDAVSKEWAEECEFLDIPFGFYFLDEAINSEEIDEEVEFIEQFLNNNSYKNNLFPIALDIEEHEGGRAEEIWEDRANLVLELLGKLKNKNINTILYSNANTANTFLSSIDTRFWLAYYPNDIVELPKKWYTDYEEQEPTQNEELMQKMIAWQFSETGAGRDITELIDVSLIERDFYKNGEDLFR